MDAMITAIERKSGKKHHARVGDVVAYGQEAQLCGNEITLTAANIADLKELLKPREPNTFTAKMPYGGMVICYNPRKGIFNLYFSEKSTTFSQTHDATASCRLSDSDWLVDIATTLLSKLQV